MPRGCMAVSGSPSMVPALCLSPATLCRRDGRVCVVHKPLLQGPHPLPRRKGSSPPPSRMASRCDAFSTVLGPNSLGVYLNSTNTHKATGTDFSDLCFTSPSWTCESFQCIGTVSSLSRVPSTKPFVGQMLWMFAERTQSLAGQRNRSRAQLSPRARKRVRRPGKDQGGTGQNNNHFFSSVIIVIFPHYLARGGY